MSTDGGFLFTSESVTEGHPDKVADQISDAIDRAGLAGLVRDHFDLRPAALVEVLNLRRPIYRQTAAYGHFGRDEPGFTWENTDKAAALRAAAGLG